MLDNLLKALSRSAPKKHTAAPAVPIKGDKVLKTYEDYIRKREQPPAILVSQVGDMYRDLRQFAEAAEKYAESAQLYVQEEAWTPALQMCRKTERTLDAASIAAPELRIKLAIVRVQVALGRGEWHDAALAISAAGDLLRPSDARDIEWLVKVVDAEPMADPEVEVALGEVLVSLGRPEMAIERYREALHRATRMKNERLVAELQSRLAQAEAYEPPARRRLRRTAITTQPESATPDDGQTLLPSAPVGAEVGAPRTLAAAEGAAPAVPESSDPRPVPAVSLPSFDVRDGTETKPLVSEEAVSSPVPSFPPIDQLRIDAEVPTMARARDSDDDDVPIVLPPLDMAQDAIRELDPGAEVAKKVDQPAVLPPVLEEAPKPTAAPELRQETSRPTDVPAPDERPVAQKDVPIVLPDVPLRLLDDEEEEGASIRETAERVRSRESGPEEARGEEGASAGDSAGYVQLDDLLSTQKQWPRDTRFVGTDARSVGESEGDQVRELVRQLRQGIREVVPAEEADTYYELGLSFLQMGLYDDAVQAFQTAFRSPELRRRAIEGLAEALLGRGDALLAHRAVRTIREELEEPGEESLGLLYWQARAAEALGQKDEALELYTQVCLLDVRFADARERLERLASVA